MPPPYATESANNGPTIMEGSTYHDATVRSTGLPAWNRDAREIKTDRPAGSAGAQSAIGRKPAEERVFRPTLLHLADRIGTRLRAKSKPGRTVTVRVRFANLNSATRSVTLDAPISATVILAEIAEELVRAVLADHPDEKTISLLAISVCGRSLAFRSRSAGTHQASGENCLASGQARRVGGGRSRHRTGVPSPPARRAGVGSGPGH